MCLSCSRSIGQEFIESASRQLPVGEADLLILAGEVSTHAHIPEVTVVITNSQLQRANLNGVPARWKLRVLPKGALPLAALGLWCSHKDGWHYGLTKTITISSP